LRRVAVLVELGTTTNIRVVAATVCAFGVFEARTNGAQSGALCTVIPSSRILDGHENILDRRRFM
jgi:hypothetical protein